MQHLHAEWHARVYVVGQKRDSAGLEVLLGTLEVILDRVEVDRRKHRPEHHQKEKRRRHDDESDERPAYRGARARWFSTRGATIVKYERSFGDDHSPQAQAHGPCLEEPQAAEE